MKTKILIIEDEIIVALDIKSALENLGYEVTTIATNHTEALQSIKENIPDIILADINLENSIDGIDTIKDIKKIHDIPVIYLTAFSDDETIKTNELKSTILLALYKSKQPNTIEIPSSYKYLGNYYFYDEENQKLYFKEVEIKLTQKERELLDVLYKKKGEIVPFKTIEYHIWEDSTVSDSTEYHIWEDSTVSDSTLRTLIYRLRSKLEYKLIETIPLSGCRLL